jgi:hypothetical protein
MVPNNKAPAEAGAFIIGKHTEQKRQYIIMGIVSDTSRKREPFWDGGRHGTCGAWPLAGALAHVRIILRGCFFLGLEKV